MAATPTAVSVNIGGGTYTLYNDYQFYDGNGNPTGVYATADHRLSDETGNANYGNWDDSGNVVVTNPNNGKSVSGNWSNSNAPISKTTGTPYTCAGETYYLHDDDHQFYNKDGKPTSVYVSNGQLRTGSTNGTPVEGWYINGTDISKTPPSTTHTTPAAYTSDGTTYYLDPSTGQLCRDAGLTQGTGSYIKGGKVVDEKGNPIPGASLNGTDITYSKPLTTTTGVTPSVSYRISFTDPKTNQPITWDLMSDGTVDINGTPTYKWTEDSAGEYHFTDDQGNPAADYINGNIVFPSPKSSTTNLPYNASDTKETVNFDSRWGPCDWTIKKDNTVWDNTTNKQIGTYADGHFSVTMPDGKVHQVDWEEGGNTLDVIGDSRGNANVTFKGNDIVGTVTDPNTGAKYILHTDGSITTNGNPVGKFTDDGTGNLSLVDNNGKDLGTYNKSTGIYTAPGSSGLKAPGPVTPTGDKWSYTDANGATHYFYFDPATQTISDDSGKPIGKYTVDPDTGAINVSGLDGTSLGKIDPDTGTLTWANGSPPVQGSYSGSGLNIPKHLPVTSNETTTQNQINNTTGTTTQNTNQNQTSGIDWSSPVAKAALPQILQQMQQLPGLAKTAGAKAQDVYKRNMVQAMSPAEFQGALNSLAGKGMVNSTIGQNTLANTENLAAKNIGNKAFNASLANTEEQMKVPQILSGMTSQLGNRATGTTGTNTTNQNVTNTLTGNTAIDKILKDPARRIKLITNLMA